MYSYADYDPAVHGEIRKPDLDPETLRRYIASDPATHGEDRNPNADPRIIKNISDIFKASKDAQEKATQELKEAWEKVIQEQKEAWEKEKQARDAQTVDIYKKAVSYVKAPDPHSGQVYNVAPHPPQNSTTGTSAYLNTAQYYAQIAIDTWMDLDNISDQVREHADHFKSSREETDQAYRESAQTAREANAQVQTETAAREQGIAVIQAEIPLLDERRAALAGGSDQAQLATAAEMELTAMRAESITKQREMMTAFMGSLTGQDEWLTGGSQHGNSASSGPSGTSGPSSDSVAEERARFLGAEPPPNLQEIYLSQFNDHDMSGFLNAEHWWEEHKQHVAKLKYGYAQGTSFAPGGLALVGEMGPELVNLPRGSQVIPNPRLGGDVHVHLNVEGSVVAERDLAQRLRQELIRTSRRTVDLGFN